MSAGLVKQLVQTHRDLSWYDGQIEMMAHVGNVSPGHQWARRLKDHGESLGKLALAVAEELGPERRATADALMSAAQNVTTHAAHLDAMASEYYATLASGWKTVLDPSITAVRAAIDALLDNATFVKPI